MKSDDKVISLRIRNISCSQDVEIKTVKEEQIMQQEPADFETAISLTGYGKFNYLLLLAAIPGTCSSVFDTSVISFVLPSAGCDLGMTNFDKGVLNGGIYAGMISSAFLWGFLSDSLGRRKLLVVGYILDGVCNLFASVSPNFWLLFLFKFLSGFVISGPYAVMISYIAELHAAKYRARVIMITGLYTSVANTFIPVIAWMIIPQAWSFTMFGGYLVYNSWRCFVTVCSIPSIVGGVVMYFFEESPKFLMTAGKNEEALRVFRKIYHTNTGKHPDTFPVKVLVDERMQSRPIVPQPEVMVHKSPLNIFKAFWKQTKPLLIFPHISKALLIFSIQFGGMLAMNTVRLWLPQLFATMQESSHHQDNSTLDASGASLCDMLNAPLAGNATKGYELRHNFTEENTPCSLGALDDQTYFNSMIIGATTTVSYFLASYFINIVGKKKLMIYGYLLSGSCGVAIYWSRGAEPTLALLALFMALGGMCTSAILSIVVDVFPTNIRTMAVSLTMMCGRIGSLLGNVTFPILLDLRCELPFFIVSGVTLGSGVLSFLLPVTIGKALE